MNSGTKQAGHRYRAFAGRKDAVDVNAILGHGDGIEEKGAAQGPLTVPQMHVGVSGTGKTRLECLAPDNWQTDVGIARTNIKKSRNRLRCKKRQIGRDDKDTVGVSAAIRLVQPFHSAKDVLRAGISFA
jgi:hypothetical protein